MIDWRNWHNEPYLVGGLVFLGGLWAVLAGPRRASSLVEIEVVGRGLTASVSPPR